MQRIRTLAEIEFEIVISSKKRFKYQEISEEAKRLRKLGMSYRKIGEALGVDDRMVRKAIDFK